MTTVLLADDEPMVLAGVRAILAADPDIEVVAEARDGRTAIDLAQRHRPDVAVLDIQMPGADGITATERGSDGPRYGESASRRARPGGRDGGRTGY